MPIESPIGITDVVEVAITRATGPHEHECLVCGKVYQDACAERFYAKACGECDPLGEWEPDE